MNVDDHDDKRLLYIKVATLFKANSGSSPFTDDSTAGFVYV